MKARFPSIGVLSVLVVLSVSGLPAKAPAEVNININLGPPPVVVAEPPAVILVPGSAVYFIPDAGADFFFHAGFWWSPRGDRWYRSHAHNGPWERVERRIVPVQIIRVPRDYRVRYGKAKHIPYGQWKKEHHRKGDDNGRRKGTSDRKAHRKPGKRGNGHGH